MSSLIDNELLTFEEVCRKLRISRRQGAKLEEAGNMPPRVLLGARRRYARSVVDAWLSARMSSTSDAA